MYRSHRPAIGTDLQTSVISGEYEHGAPAIYSVLPRTEIAGAFSITARRKVSDSLLHKCRRLLRPGFISFGQKRYEKVCAASSCLSTPPFDCSLMNTPVTWAQRYSAHPTS